VVLIVAGFGAFLLLAQRDHRPDAQGRAVGPINLTIKVDPGVTAPNDSLLDRSRRVTAVRGSGQWHVHRHGPERGRHGRHRHGHFHEREHREFSDHPGRDPGRDRRQDRLRHDLRGHGAEGARRRSTGLTLIPATADVSVTAVKKGLAGNVAAGAIVNVPAWLATALVVADQVTNKKATSGGTHTVTPFVQQSDIDAAEASLAAS
jgi:hypothetical protein